MTRPSVPEHSCVSGQLMGFGQLMALAILVSGARALGNVERAA